MAITAFRFGTAFSPLDYAPALWLKDTGNAAGTWPDSSTYGRDATQGTAGSQPQIVQNALNGKQVRRFNGTSSFMSCGDVLDLLSNSITIFSVFKISAYSPAGSGIIAKSRQQATTGRYAIFRSGNNLQLFRGAPDAIAAATYPLKGFSVVCGRIDRANGTLNLFDNGSLIAQNSFTPDSATSYDTADPFLIGCYPTPAGNVPATGFYLNGDIAEIIVYPTALSEFQRQRVEAYLNQKYAIY